MKMQTSVNVKAAEVQNNGDGVFTIIVEGEELPEETLKLFRELFPNTCDRVFDLLSIETMLKSIVKDYHPTSLLPPEKVRPAKSPR